jgi:hypothetical protein
MDTAVREVSERQTVTTTIRLVLVSDGIIDRTSPDGRALSIEGVVDAIRDAPFASAAGAVSAVEEVVRTVSDEELLDDATVAVLTPVLRSA